MNAELRPLRAKLTWMPMMLILAAVVGCERGASTPKCTTKLHGLNMYRGWHAPGQQPPPQVPGLDRAEVEFALYDGSVVLVLWADTTRASRSKTVKRGEFNYETVDVPIEHPESKGIHVTDGGWDKSLKTAKYTGYIGALDGRKIPFEWSTPDGETGTVIIDEETFRLEDGGLFLVSTLTGKANVKQLDETSGFSAQDPGGPQRHALSHPSIRAFFLDAVSQHRENAPEQENPPDEE